jgi:hypothetical protein
MVNRFPIACILGFKWAKKRGLDDELAKAIGYGISLAPNIARKGSMFGMTRERGVWQSKGGLEERNLDKLEGKFDEVLTFGNWDFVRKGEKICLARMRKLEWWNAENYNRAIRSKLSPEEIDRAYKIVNELWKDLSADEINYRYAKNYKTFWQKSMDETRQALAYNIKIEKIEAKIAI